jgi:hypothetical protein
MKLKCRYLSGPQGGRCGAPATHWAIITGQNNEPGQGQLDGAQIIAIELCAEHAQEWREKFAMDITDIPARASEQSKKAGGN